MLPGRFKTQLTLAVLSCWWCLSTDALSGKYVCIEKQKYNLTKVIKVRAPVAVRSYEWCLAIPPRCERWHTELRDVTRLETEERSADIPVCCAGFAVRDERCVPRCPPGRTGHTCNIGCSDGRWGASCTHQCICPRFSTCDAKDGKCICTEGWAGPSCDRKIDAIEVSHIPGIFNWKTETTTKRFFLSTSTTPTTQTTTLPSTTTAVTALKTTTTEVTALPTTTTSAPDLPTMTTPAAVSATMLTSAIAVTTTKIYTPSTIKTADIPSITITQTEETTVMPRDKLTPTISNTSTVKANEITETITTNIPQPSTTVKTTVNTRGSQTVNNVSITTTEISKMATTMHTEEPPKEIWIKQAQQGENKSSETKLKSITEYQRPSTKRPETTTVRTIILSIISISNSTTVAQYIPHHSSVYKLKGIPSSESRIVNITKYPTSSTSRLYTAKITKPNTQQTRTTPKYTTFETDMPVLEPNITTTIIGLKLITNNNESASATSVKTMHVILENDSQTTLTEATKTESTSRPIFVEDENFNLTSTNPIRTELRPTNSSKTKNLFMQSIETQKPSTKTSTTTPKATFAKLPNVSKSSYTTSTSSVHLSGTDSKTAKTFDLKETTSFSESSKITGKVMQTQSNTLPNSPSTIALATQQSETQNAAENATNTPNAMQSVTSNIFLENRTNTNTRTLIHSNVTAKENNMLLMDAKKNANDTMMNVTKNETNIAELTTENSLVNEEETFNILTEPEHITSVIGEGSPERGGTDDLLSLLSIVGGGMMAVILVAVVIVMMERCRKSQHSGSVMDKSDDMDLKVAMESHQGKSYVRSIFHSPLPEPPVYRNMKPVEQTNYMGQFSRPVVLHELSPALIDNFRGILESHYDHLPPRSSRPLSAIREHSHINVIVPSIEILPNEVCSIPSCQDTQHSHNRLYPVTESAIETLKLESTIPQADYANLEPLYAEIPCWRPHAHYANEVVNLNSEAVTEL